MRKATIAALVLTGALAFGQERTTRQGPPATMLKIVVRLTGPGISDGSSASLPRTIYDASPHYARIEDPPDAPHKVQRVTIIAEPDAYSVNLIDKTGTHAIDHGGPDDLHLPIVLAFDPDHKLGNLDRIEFGDELDVFQAAGAVKTTEAGTSVYTLKTAAGPVTLVVKVGSNIPSRLTFPGSGGFYSYEYASYEEVRFEPALFSAPPGIEWRRIEPDPQNAQ